MARPFGRWLRTDQDARREIDEEIQAHLQARIEHLAARGASPEAARAEALRRFGDLEAGRRALLAQARLRRVRLRLGHRLEQLAQDVRYVVRSLLRAPAFSLGVVFTLALGLGINAAVFRVADQVLLRAPAGVGDAGTVFKVETTVDFGSGPLRSTMFSYGDAQRVVESAGFESAAIYSPPRVQRDGQGREIAVSVIDAKYLPVLGVRPAQGRGFLPGEASPGAAARVALLSHEYWRRAFGRVAPAEGSTIAFGGRTYDVVGVAPPGFSGIDLEPADVWIPLGDGEFGQGMVNGVTIPWYRSDMLRALRVIGRRSSSRGPDVVAQRVTAALASADEEQGRPPRTALLTSIVPAGDPARNQDAQVLLRRLTAVAAVVLVLAGANAMNLLLARGVRRRGEFGVRLALGASRGRIVGLLLVESVTLALAGGAAAALCGHWTSDALRRLVFPDARWTVSAFDERTLIFTGLAALAAGVATGLAPALQATRPDVIAALKDGRAPGPGARKTRSTLVVVQTALSLAVVVSSALLVLSLVRLNAVPLGFDPAGLLTVSLPGNLTDPAPDGTEMVVRLAAVSGVRGVALASVAPFGATAMMDITVPGSSFVPESDRDLPQYAVVSENYFTVMGVRLLDGRGFASNDTAGSEPVAVVNAAMARRYWGSGSPYSSCIQAAVCARVVGIVEDVRDGPGGAAPMRFYLPTRQSDRTPAVVVIRADETAVGAVAGTARSLLGPAQRATIEVAADRVARTLRPWRTATLLFVTLGVVALSLACVGLYSVMSYLVSERTRELGVRMALGATRMDIVCLVVRAGLRLVIVGGVAGLAAAAAGARFLNALLFGVSPYEPAVYALGFAALAATACAAMLLPARRASRVDPVTALRTE